ncbi:RNA pseudouridylate synthase domain-containing protein 2-like isoform X1 [Amphibalanus amphitrite]|uniref:RNA pseudouridylate synthase domain-containing protein 2-like isoform X1 n=1 Tax=Amphibalanus amphitrite TaxID=1232801 RepID=UPI001C92169F|nr:RNA pseudouridylate synthase domain-containing protein 2-like isoform X1 [Amphibalanus amphitrite]XP_043216270.1 RNA pseudouridylate synthase domain-containing protein 2-like isoform X1 [Amphibalanus amphitrite]
MFRHLGLLTELTVSCVHRALVPPLLTLGVSHRCPGFRLMASEATQVAGPAVLTAVEGGESAGGSQSEVQQSGAAVCEQRGAETGGVTLPPAGPASSAGTRDGGTSSALVKHGMQQEVGNCETPEEPADSETPAGPAGAGSASEPPAEETVSTTPKSTDQELVNGLVLDKRKRDDDDESPELKKVKLDPRLACLLQAKLETKALKAKRPGFTDERYTETSYWFENGLRKVYPYYFTFTTFTKGRWVGEKILDVFAREFRAHPAEEYERCIRAGTLTVNYQKVDVDHRLRHNDLLANVVHRHEVPITADPVPLVHMDDDIVVVDKPSSIPVHPCGRYRHNTVVFILAKEHGLKNLRTIHRLDRLTSGLLMFGRTPAKARDMEQQIRTRQVTKEYVCRVEGEFPSEPISCKEPIEVVSYKIGVCKVSPKGKECLTEFTRLNYNGRSSVVVCRPQTGRMHQIRVHLQYLGYPIINDPLYNHTVFGPGKGKGGTIEKSDEQLIQDLIAIHNAENWLGMDGDVELSMFKPKEAGEMVPPVPARCRDGSPATASPGPSETAGQPAAPASAVPQTQRQTGGSEAGAPIAAAAEPGARDGETPPAAGAAGAGGGGGGGGTFRPELMVADPHCYECKVRYRDPKPSDLVMYLHALKYAGPGWQYETKMPDWAAEDWRDPDGKA